MRVFYLCGICAEYHARDWDGDCRQDDARFSPEELDELFGHSGWVEVPMPGGEDDIVTIYLKPGVLETLDVWELEKNVERPIGIGNDFVNVYTQDANIVRALVELIGTDRITEVPFLEGQ